MYLYVINEKVIIVDSHKRSACPFHSSKDLIIGILLSPVDKQVQHKSAFHKIFGDSEFEEKYREIEDKKKKEEYLRQHMKRKQFICYGKSRNTYRYRTVFDHTTNYTYSSLIHYRYEDKRGWNVENNKNKHSSQNEKIEEAISNLTYSEKYLTKSQMDRAKSYSIEKRKLMFLHHGIDIINHFLYMIMLSCLKTVLDKHGIEYYMHQGTLIGSMRNHDIIPWDDDCDIVVIVENPYKTLLALHEITSSEVIGYVLGRTTNFQKSYLTSTLKESPLNIDVWKKMKNNLTAKNILKEKSKYSHSKTFNKNMKNNDLIQMVQMFKLFFKDHSFFLPYHQLPDVNNIKIGTRFSYPVIDIWLSYPSASNKERYYNNYYPFCQNDRYRGAIIIRNILTPSYHRPLGPLWLKSPFKPSLYLLTCLASQKLLNVLTICVSPKWNHQQQRNVVSFSIECEQLREYFPLIQFNKRYLKKMESSDLSCMDNLSMDTGNLKERSKEFFSSTNFTQKDNHRIDTDFSKNPKNSIELNLLKKQFSCEENLGFRNKIIQTIHIIPDLNND
ncbi:hypothetical protein SNEBB_009000 [Seison nebaliae]|nr:hypothetical protein SNEBB_009000 [Seison nebaliae]